MQEEMYKGYTIKIRQDEMPPNPRKDWDNLGTMVCFHKRYILGDEGHGLNSDNFNSWDDVYDYIKKELDGYIILPLRLYDHSGITMSTSTSYPYNDQWDSMWVGFIYITAKKIREEYNVKRISKKLKERVTGYLVGEVETYDQYLIGDVWGYEILDPEGNELDDSCWGFFGDKYCLEEAQGIVDWHIKDRLKKRLEKVKQWIKNRVPLHHRRLATL